MPSMGPGYCASGNGSGSDRFGLEEVQYVCSG